MSLEARPCRATHEGAAATPRPFVVPMRYCTVKLAEPVPALPATALVAVTR
jgi:hypothetical protein